MSDTATTDLRLSSSIHSTSHYSRVAIALHWLLAVALIYQVVLGWWMLGLPKTPPGLRAGWFNLHKSVGISIAIVVLVRLAWRMGHGPAPAEGLPAWQQRAAWWSHALLYSCMLGLPLSGYLGSAFSGYPVRYYGAALPAWTPTWPAGKQAMASLHLGLVWLFMGLVTLHVAAALWHWHRRDGVAARMGLPLSQRMAP
jgi:cytochrome b561